MRCDCCEMCRVNGVPIHEAGCPNDGKAWEGGEWVRYVACWECGCDVREGEECGCCHYDDAEPVEVAEPGDRWDGLS